MFPSYEQVMTQLEQESNQYEQDSFNYVQFLKKHGLFLGGILVAVFLFFLIFPPISVILLPVFIIYLIYFIYKLSKKHQDIRLFFKERIVGRMVQEILKACTLPYETDKYKYECSYYHQHRIADPSIRSSHLFNYQIDKTHGEDLFQGIIGLTDFQFSELTLKQIQVTRDAKGRTTRREITMFDGVLFVAYFHKEFEGVTTLTSANLFNSGTLGSWLNPLQKLGSILTGTKKISIQLEDVAFNKVFHVRTTDEIKARYILSSNMMERLLKFKKQHREKIEISFVNSTMNIALSSGRNYFEPVVMKPHSDREIRQVYDDIVFFFNMIEEFDLNTRIWSKQ
jgi:hypothetical protein